MKEAYENLRQQVLAALPGSGRLGLPVLLREGMAAWIESGAAAAPRSLPSRLSEPPRLLASPLQAGIVQILVSIALSRAQETHP